MTLSALMYSCEKGVNSVPTVLLTQDQYSASKDILKANRHTHWTKIDPIDKLFYSRFD